jgi:hypothetical protein
MQSRDTDGSVDVGGVLGIPGKGTYLVFGVYLVTILGLALSAGGAPMRSWSGWLGLTLALAAALLVVLPDSYPFSLMRTIAVVGATTATSILVPLELDGRLGAGYAAWHVLANTLTLLGLAVRGRILFAWIGFALMVAMTALWTTVDGAGPLTGVLMLQRESVALLGGSFFAIALRRLVRRLRRLHAVENQRAAESATTRAAIQERGAQMRRFDGDVRSTLLEIASGTPRSAERRSGYAALEGALRDRIRAPAFASEGLDASVGRARRRGVDVLLLDDSGSAPMPAGVREELARRVGALVDETLNGRVTARLVAADDCFTVTVTITATAPVRADADAGDEPATHARFDLCP